MSDEETKNSDFIREAVAEDLKSGRFNYVRTRLPPEPNGYLHIGHVKAWMIDYLIAKENNGELILRFDDTNPAKEETEFVEAIEDDTRWLGVEWAKVTFASDYFDELYAWAQKLILAGKAYVDDQTPEEVSANRGTLTTPGKNSPFRDRDVEENMDLLERMKNGEFPDGSRILRAKIDMAHPNINMRDPAMYRIVHKPHHRTGEQWKIYPMYDWSHGQNDSMEGITHSLCSLEYEDHRPLYEWFLEQLGVFKPRQIEFARLNINYTVMSKRKLRRLVEEKLVSGWDDPRMPTLRAMRRRGYTPEAIRDFIDRVGVAKNYSVNDVALLESCVREDLNKRALRRMAVLKPLKVIIDNYPDSQTEEMDAVNNPEDPSAGTRKIPFSKVIYIEQDDFREVPPPKYYRFFPGNEVRLRYAYFIKCTHVVKDENGEVIEVHATYDPSTRGGDSADGRKVKSTIHWVSAEHAKEAEIRMYDRLFTKEDPEEGDEGFLACLNPNSLVISTGYVEPALSAPKAGDRFQFERQGYFCADIETSPEKPVFNLTVNLKDAWSKIEKKAK
ncbi:MAG: glutamine--tRNA ligase/YqeY domain fusion protein [Anaerolineales bacterium]|uniref:glutamine--tRNA ligase/YqeY domain fusion protein n=1 Tax=Candidatus Villigracilis proximus TaxID=3140683 RepID=UPI0031352CF7|nr:glutamine--tRNA ligase/YqeY domain fusion protein [Anaerolineales bacterium]